MAFSTAQSNISKQKSLPIRQQLPQLKTNQTRGGSNPVLQLGQQPVAQFMQIPRALISLSFPNLQTWKKPSIRYTKRLKITGAEVCWSIRSRVTIGYWAPIIPALPKSTTSCVSQGCWRRYTVYRNSASPVPTNTHGGKYDYGTTLVKMSVSGYNLDVVSF